LCLHKLANKLRKSREPSRGSRKIWRRKASRSVPEVPVNIIFERLHHDVTDHSRTEVEEPSAIPEPTGGNVTHDSEDDSTPCFQKERSLMIVDSVDEPSHSVHSTVPLAILPPLSLDENVFRDQQNQIQEAQNEVIDDGPSWTVVSKKKKQIPDVNEVVRSKRSTRKPARYQ
jgi:hypothetical protein